MSERLSRMERYGQRRSPKDKQHRSGNATRKQPEHQISSEAKSRVQSLKGKKLTRKQQNRETGFYTDRSTNAAADAALMEQQSYEVIPVSRQVLEEAAPTLTAEELPSRREVYPSQRVKLTRYFFNTLLFIFIAVMVVLFWWGISESPWGQNHSM
ncbi:hypothetical protein [Paenibacillus bouchesdurhonensis]|uniref:hypothetical protein n=1 Tax=Paenibacillus bouchesdurhonensis TaxID=1870990 RepID=UPI000DA60B1C|nr:hypothetical protein [Paenibacillus bouchesdurhonensis]